MINFSRTGSIVKAVIEANVGVENRFFNISINLSDEAYAYMLIENLQTKMRDALHEIRREAYEQGWREAKSKKAKQAWFSGGW